MKEILQALNELKNNKIIDDYAIGGGIAALFYIEPFLTFDLDVFIIPTEKTKCGNLIILSPVYEYLEKKGCSWKGEHIIVGGVPVQFIPADGLEREAVGNAKEIKYEGIKSKVLTPEYLITVLLRAGRKKDLEKIEILLKLTDIDRNKLGDVLRRYRLSEKFRRLL
ncbi:MAG: hypothetical protein AB1742_15325 [bacterium]